MARKTTTPKRPAKPEKPPKPEMFVGSSGEAVRLSDTVVLRFRHEFRVTPWTAGVFEPSSNPLADLVRQLNKTAYGVFILAKDDRVTSRGKQYEAARDNVLFELGLFMGKLGPENCFILAPKDRKKLKIPSDLEGFSLVSYEDERLADNAQAALAGACAEISAAIARRRRDSTEAPTADVALSATRPRLPLQPPHAKVQAHLQDLLGMIHLGNSGMEVVPRDQAKVHLWAKNALHMTLLALKDVTQNLPPDAYVAWLRPTSDDRERLIFFLGENTPADFAATHHPFSLGEGLAGSVWSEGQSASHSSAQPHPKWRPRAECRNESYMCVPVGKTAGAGGVLGFGSDQGFKTEPGHISVLEAFASLLAVVVPPDAWWTPKEGHQAGRGSSSWGSTSRSRGQR